MQGTTPLAAISPRQTKAIDQHQVQIPMPCFDTSWLLAEYRSALLHPLYHVLDSSTPHAVHIIRTSICAPRMCTPQQRPSRSYTFTEQNGATPGTWLLSPPAPCTAQGLAGPQDVPASTPPMLSCRGPKSLCGGSRFHLVTACLRVRYSSHDEQAGTPAGLQPARQPLIRPINSLGS